MNLHGVDLAFGHFPRVVGVHEGRILFDRAPGDISTADLEALYPPKMEEARRDFLSFAAVPDSEPIRVSGGHPG
jgi:ABC-type phosphate/phosphonate transport system ATPase subunit